MLLVTTTSSDFYPVRSITSYLIPITLRPTALNRTSATVTHFEEMKDGDTIRDGKFGIHTQRERQIDR